MRVPFAPASVAVVRTRLKKWMAEQGVARDRIEDARVIVSEMVANAVRHAQPLPDGSIAISWFVADRGLQISVTDGGSSTQPHKVDAPSSALAGRGLKIIESLAVEWWAERSRSRSTVHALLPTG